MVTAVSCPINSFSDLKSFVYGKICQDYDLLIDTFSTTETVLKRCGASCGVMFCLHGPRSVKFTAIWEKEHNRVLFYGPNGKRYARVHLDNAAVLLTEAPS